MRFLLLLIILALAFYFYVPEPEPRPIEETFIGDQIKPLQKAEGFEDEFLKGADERKKKMEEELERSGG
jgi:hypothetical protein